MATNSDPLRWLMRLAAAAGAAVSIYLLIVSLRSAGLPAGCGAGSGCATVLSSRWAGVFGIPISGPAALGYVAAFVASFFVGSAQPPARRRFAWTMLIAVAASVIAAAAWFIVLQVFIVRAICPWCMAGHALGLAFAIAALIAATRTEIGKDVRSVAWRTGVGIGIGVLMVAALVAGQFLVEYKPGKVARLPVGQNADSGPGPDRVMQVLNGGVQLQPHDEPMLGSPDAAHVLVVAFDYCCPHCRTTHGYLLSAMQRYSGQVSMLALPMPMNQSCNKYVTETEPRFEHACELARLALAVWKADRGKFAEFDSWLFEPESPRNPAEAKRKAEGLVGAAALGAALENEWVNRQIARNVEIYHISRAERIPVIMGAKLSGIEGEPDSAEHLYRLLETELGVQAGRP